MNPIISSTIVGIAFSASIAMGAPPHGVQEFRETGTWVAPKGVKAVQVELWGAGGGGGSAMVMDMFGGGSGGGGGYVRGWINVKPKQSYAVTIGTGGAGGVSTLLTGGQSGGATYIESPGFVHAWAPGGNGGGFSNMIGGAPGLGGQVIEEPGFLMRNGNDGTTGPMMMVPIAAVGGAAVQGSVAINDSVGTATAVAAGGVGGNAFMGSGISDGAAGGRGHVILSW